MGVVFVCVGLLVAIPIGLLIGAAILRGAVSLANMCVGGEKPRSSYDDDYEDYGEYRRPRRSNDGGSIPEPGIGQAMLIVLCTAILNGVLGLMAGFAVGVGGAAAQLDQKTVQILAQLVGLPIGFLTSSFVLTGMLPTSFGRACLVTLFQYVIVIAIAVVVGGIVFAVVVGLQGR
ncbi:MAG: hypothetical protein K8U57_13080 [Planctomycetes bacterium]|nr:hypothetical protein [Planctomycetota bacterium]